MSKTHLFYVPHSSAFNSYLSREKKESEELRIKVNIHKQKEWIYWQKNSLRDAPANEQQEIYKAHLSILPSRYENYFHYLIIDRLKEAIRDGIILEFKCKYPKGDEQNELLYSTQLFQPHPQTQNLFGHQRQLCSPITIYIPYQYDTYALAMLFSDLNKICYNIEDNEIKSTEDLSKKYHWSAADLPLDTLNYVSFRQETLEQKYVSASDEDIAKVNELKEKGANSDLYLQLNKSLLQFHNNNKVKRTYYEKILLNIDEKIDNTCILKNKSLFNAEKNNQIYQIFKDEFAKKISELENTSHRGLVQKDFNKYFHIFLYQHKLFLMPGENKEDVFQQAIDYYCFERKQARSGFGKLYRKQTSSEETNEIIAALKKAQCRDEKIDLANEYIGKHPNNAFTKALKKLAFANKYITNHNKPLRNN